MDRRTARGEMMEKVGSFSPSLIAETEQVLGIAPNDAPVAIENVAAYFRLLARWDGAPERGAKERLRRFAAALRRRQAAREARVSG